MLNALALAAFQSALSMSALIFANNVLRQKPRGSDLEDRRARAEPANREHGQSGIRALATKRRGMMRPSLGQAFAASDGECDHDRVADI